MGLDALRGHLALLPGGTSSIELVGTPIEPAARTSADQARPNAKPSHELIVSGDSAQPHRG